MPSAPNFKTDHNPQDLFNVSGAWANKVGTALNGALGQHISQVGSNSQFGVDIPAPPFIFGIATITSAADAYEIVDGEYTAPQGTDNKYLATFRYWDFSQGFWLEKTEEDVRIDASVYYERPATEASALPSSGVGYGAIPTYAIGDNVPCYWDRMRNWLIPVASAFEQFPTAGFASDERKTVPEGDSTVDTATYYAVVEVNRVNIDEIDQWAQVAAIAIRLPTLEERKGGYDSRSCFGTVDCPHGSMIRIRETRGNFIFGSVDRTFCKLKLTGEARRGARSVCFPKSPGAPEGGQFINTLALEVSAPGRWKDSPTFEHLGDSEGRLIARYLDPLDEWIIRVDMQVVIEFLAEGDESSGSPSSLSSSSSSASTSSQSLSSQSSRTPSSQSSQSFSSQSLSASSLSSSSRSSCSRSSSGDSVCIVYPACFAFNAETCEFTITWNELCLPGSSGATINSDVTEPVC